ncbi:MAG: LysR family transcriptional regulator [Pseudomonadota bacterium]
MNAQIIPRLDWSDVPFLLAVCEHGSLSAAARALGVNHSTVFRRVEIVEAKLGVRLFERQPRGYAMTAAGEYFLDKASKLCAGMNEIELHLGGQDLRLEGRLAITTTDSLLHVLTPVIAKFQDSHPKVELHISAETRGLDLARREADIAIRPTDQPPEFWVGRKLGPVAMGVYATQAYWDTIKEEPDFIPRWITLRQEISQSPMSKLATACMPKGAPVTVMGSLMGLYDMVCSGVGIAAMPCYLAHSNPNLVCIEKPEHGSAWGVWLLAHPDVRRSARVHALYEFLSLKLPFEFFDPK